jgi:gas vesicle protein
MMMRTGFGKGIVLGSIIGVTAGLYMNNNSSKGMKRIKRDSRGVINQVMDLVGDFKSIM